MPRTARASQGGFAHHAINRGNGRQKVFHKPEEYDSFVELVGEANERIAMRVTGYCLMPNHFYLVLWPRGDGDLSRWMQWLLTAHVRRYHRHYTGNGHVWQGRFKAFPIQHDGHYLRVVRYVERNPLRAKLVARAEDWKWSSLTEFSQGASSAVVSEGPVAKTDGWTRWVNGVETASELEAIRQSVNRGTPFGDDTWKQTTAKRLGLEASIRPRGRPPKA